MDAWLADLRREAQTNADAAAGLASLWAVAAEPVVTACYDAGTIDRGLLGPSAAWQVWVRETLAEAARRRKEMARSLGDADQDDALPGLILPRFRRPVVNDVDERLAI